MKRAKLFLSVSCLLASTAWYAEASNAPWLPRSTPDYGFYPGYNDIPPTLNSSMLHPTVRDLQRLIEDDPDMYMGFQQMFEQVPNTTKYQTDLAGIGPQIRSYQHMLYRLNQILSWAPTYGDGTFPFVPLPMTAMFTWPTCTSAGYRMFTNDLVNAHFKLILTAWAHFLSTPASRYTLSAAEGGWFSSPALQAMPNFTTTFVCNPEEEFFGYKSFDDFFTRGLQEGVRPVDAPDDDSVIGNACESSPYNIGRNVKERDMFWIKGEPYSLRHMLNNDESTSQFIGGTVYQAFLFATSYHRWHSPVNGKIVKVVHVQGTYFSISTALGFEASSDPDPVAAGYSQAYMTTMATRMLIFIQADNPKIGLMAFGAVGMVEVSSCEATVKEGQRVKKGDQLGMFHYGGSGYFMVFRPETGIVIDKKVEDALGDLSIRLLVNQRVGTVGS